MLFSSRFTRALLSTLFTVLPQFGVVSALASGYGLENEYATVGFMDPSWGERHMLLAESLLAIVQKEFKGGKISREPWEKYPEKKLMEVVYIDPKGREWKIVPESVNTSGLDGLEFVTPRLDSRQEIVQLQTILTKVRAAKKVMKGLRSSSHMTLDVSHLLKDKNNVNELVNLILFIESNWTHIYRYLNPQRYGTLVNRFSVPLAADQPDLLRDLQNLPVARRTLDNVRAIFLKYELREAHLRDADQSNPARKWKYRAANYGKLLGLSGTKAVPVIEFRIGDLEFGQAALEKFDFLSAVLEQRSKVFTNPFGNKALSTWKAANEKLIAVYDEKKYANFIENLNEHSRPHDGAMKFQVKESRSWPKAQASTIALQDANSPIDINGNKITYGFELEFRGDRAAKVINPDTNLAKIEKYPFLDGVTGKEASGNLEIRSIGGEWILSEVLEQMKTMKNVLREDSRGFHLHIKIPKNLVDQHLEENLEAWLAILSDYVFTWRLQYRMHFFALKVWSQQRQLVDFLGKRGPIRLTKNKDHWDIEIRGLMGDIDMIGSTTQKIVTAFLNPEVIKANVNEQRDLRRVPRSLADALKAYAKFYLDRELTPSEESIAKELAESLTDQNILPLFNFQSWKALDPQARKRIADANQMFFKETLTVIANRINGKYETVSHAATESTTETDAKSETEKQFRFRIKRWAQAVDLHSLLDRALFLPYEVNQNLTQYNERLENLLRPILSQQLAALNDTSEASLAILMKGLESDDTGEQKIVEETIDRLIKRLPIEFIEKMASHSNPKVKDIVASHLNYWLDDGEKIIALLIETGTPSTLRTAMTSLGKIANKKAFELLLILMKDPELEPWAQNVVNDRKDMYAVKILAKLLVGRDVYARHVAARTLSKIDTAASFEAIKAELNNPTLQIKKNALSGLAGSTKLEALDIIKKSLEDSELLIRQKAASLLSTINSPRVINLIEIAFRSEDSNIRKSAVSALEGNTNQRAFAILKKALVDSDEFVQNRALHSLTPAHTEHLKLVLGYLENPKSLDRETAIRILSQAKGPLVLKLRKTELNSGDTQTRKTIVLSSSGLNDIEALEIYKLAMTDNELSVRRVIMHALKSRNSSIVFMPLIKDALHDTDETVRKNAAMLHTKYLRELHINQTGSLRIPISANGVPSIGNTCEDTFI